MPSRQQPGYSAGIVGPDLATDGPGLEGYPALRNRWLVSATLN
jgi:hypothetical protein